MSKTKILLNKNMAAVGLGVAIGLAFWILDGGRTSKKASDCPGGVSNAQEMASAKVYQGRWHKDYLEVIK